MSISPRHLWVAVDKIRSAKELLIAHGLGTGSDIDSHPEWLAGEIDRSWRRSISAGAERRPDSVQFVNAFDADSELLRAARPVLDRFADMLHDMGTAIFLADRTGQIVLRRTGRSDRNKFDNAQAAEGFNFSEESIGTNGLGTPLQESGSVFIRGPEHFNEALEELACAGAVIRHPVTGRVLGSFSLSAPLDSAETMMLAMTREGARQIIDNLSANVGQRELALGRSYQRHRDKGPVIVLNNDTVMTNVTGLSFLNVESHARLWEALTSRDWSEGPHVVDLDLQALQGKVLARRLDDVGDEPAFAVEILNRRVAVASRESRSKGLSSRDPFVGQLHRAASLGSGAVVITGPSGSGKLHTAREWLHTAGASEPMVLDAGDFEANVSWRTDARAALESGRAVVLRRLENVPVSQLSAVKALGERELPARLLVTADLSRCTDETKTVLSHFATGPKLPPLASRVDEIRSLAEAMMAGIPGPRRPVLTTPTMQVFLRWHWPGNLTELKNVLDDLARELPGQSVNPYHLPERMWDAANRRTLTRIESVERSEIVSALRQAVGNRSKAAALLGIGRTTLYRKLRALGIDETALLPVDPEGPST